MHGVVAVPLLRASRQPYRLVLLYLEKKTSSSLGHHQVQDVVHTCTLFWVLGGSDHCAELSSRPLEACRDG